MECVKGSVSSALRVYPFALAHVESHLWEVDKILSLDCDSNPVPIFSDCLRERLGIAAHKRPVKECGLTQLTARCQTFRGWICWRYLIGPAWNDVHQVVAKQDARTIPCFVGEATISSASSKWRASSLYTWGWWMTFLPSHFEETHAMGCFAYTSYLIDLSWMKLLDSHGISISHIGQPLQNILFWVLQLIMNSSLRSSYVVPCFLDLTILTSTRLNTSAPVFWFVSVRNNLVKMQLHHFSWHTQQPKHFNYAKSKASLPCCTLIWAHLDLIPSALNLNEH